MSRFAFWSCDEDHRGAVSPQIGGDKSMFFVRLSDYRTEATECRIVDVTGLTSVPILLYYLQ